MNLLQYVKPYRKQFTIGSVAKLTEAILELYLPILMAQILDIGIPMGAGGRGFILWTGLKMLLISLVGFGCAATCQYYAAVTSYGAGSTIRSALMKHITELSFTEQDQFGTTTLINRLTTDVYNYQTAIAMSMRLLFRAPFIFIGAIFMSLMIDTSLALIFLALIPFISLVIFVFLRVTSPLYAKAQKQLDKFALIVRENLSGIRVIRAFATTKQEETRAKQVADDVKDANFHVSTISAWMQPISSIFLNFGILLILFFGARKVFAGRIKQGEILALTIYATKILYALGIFANLIIYYTKAAVSSGRILEVLQAKLSLDYPIHSDLALFAENAQIAVELKKVGFGFNEETAVLRDITFTLNQGESLGVVGVTGAGKTSLIDLIQRFYDSRSGEILLWGKSIGEYSKEELRRLIGVVPQENQLFFGTVAENIRFGKKNATDEEIIHALKTAQCWDFVSAMPQGMESPIFEGGKNFSGGQKQRLTIARALVSDPELLILDDSLSALDYQTDLRLRQALAAEYPRLTTIIVSQRISSVVSTDHILLLDHGEMIGFGTHDELREKSPLYREIYSSQTDSLEGGQANEWK